MVKRTLRYSPTQSPGNQVTCQLFPSTFFNHHWRCFSNGLFFHSQHGIINVSNEVKHSMTAKISYIQHPNFRGERRFNALPANFSGQTNLIPWIIQSPSRDQEVRCPKVLILPPHQPIFWALHSPPEMSSLRSMRLAPHTSCWGFESWPGEKAP